MALYDNSKISGFYTTIAHEQHTCHYCERAIVKQKENREISRDEMHKRIRALKGHLTGQRVMRLTILGVSYCVCNDCLKAVNNELEKEISFEKIIKNEMLETVSQIDSEIAEQTEQSTDNKKNKSKGKK